MALFIFLGCYRLEKDVKESIGYTTFKNETTIWGLELQLASTLPKMFQAKTSLQETEPFHAKYQISGEIIDYKKKIIRRDSKGEPTHQQVIITVNWQINQGKNIIQKLTNTNEDHNLNSGLYNINKSESEKTALGNALNDLASIIADKTELVLKFKGKE